MPSFDTLLKPSLSIPVSYVPDNPQEAYIAVFYSILYAKEECTENDISSLKQFILSMDFFKEYDTSFYIKKVITAHSKFRSKLIIEGSFKFLRFKFKIHLFSCCCELTLADGAAYSIEKENLLYQLAGLAEISNVTASNIMEIALKKMTNSSSAFLRQ